MPSKAAIRLAAERAIAARAAEVPADKTRALALVAALALQVEPWQVRHNDRGFDNYLRLRAIANLTENYLTTKWADDADALALCEQVRVNLILTSRAIASAQTPADLILAAGGLW